MKKIGAALIILILSLMVCTIDGDAQDREYDDQDGLYKKKYLEVTA